MPLRSALTVPVVLTLVLVTGCSSMSRKFTFMRPDLSRREFTRTAPEYDIKPDKARNSSLAAGDMVARAAQYLRSGQLDEAEAGARSALKRDAKSADAYTILALVADQRGQPSQAGGYYAKAAELAPTRGGIANNYGAWLCGNGRAAESLGWFDRALADATYPTPAAARANAGACAMDAGQTARAERDLRMALSQQPENPTALAAMAQVSYANGNFLDARAFSERRLAVGPATREILQLASQIEQKLGDNRASARYMQQMAAQFPQRDAQPGETARK